MGARKGRSSGFCIIIGMKRSPGALGIDILVERNAKPAILHPGHTARDFADIAQFHSDAVAALNINVRTFGHHPAIGQIAHAHAMTFRLLFNLNVGQQKQTVAQQTASFHPCHYPPDSAALNLAREISACANREPPHLGKSRLSLGKPRLVDRAEIQPVPN